MRRFPFAAMALILLSGVCFIIFITANYALDNPDNGLFTKLDESASNTMNTARYNWFNDRIDHIRTGFGLSALILFSVGIIVAIATGFSENNE